MGEDDVRSVPVFIAGRSYTLRGRLGEERLRELAEHVNKTMTEITGQHARLDPQQVAVLAALNIADELFRIRDENDRLIRILEEE